MYKIDLHVHTEEISSCAKTPAAEVVRLYHQAGYQAIVITDHFYRGFFVRQPAGLTWEQAVDRYLQGYREALKAAAATGLTVLYGMELRFTENDNDYLVYGFEESFLKEHPNLYQLSLAQFYQITRHRQQNILIYQAHPFRAGMIPADPALIDGVEIFNGNQRHDSHNQLAYRFAKTNQLLMISGSDFHEREDLAQGGITVAAPVRTMAELLTALQANSALKYLGM